MSELPPDRQAWEEDAERQRALIPAPQRPVHVLQADRPDYGVGTTYTCSCGAWDGWATGPTSTARVKAEWQAHAGLAGHREGPIIDGDAP